MARATRSRTGGRLATVTDTFGNGITFTYDGSGRFGGFVAPESHLRLRLRRHGTAHERHLSGQRDPHVPLRESEFRACADRDHRREWRPLCNVGLRRTGRATLSQHAGGVDSVTLYYGSFSPTANDGPTTVVDGFGTTRTYYYQVAGGVVRIRYVTDPSERRSPRSTRTATRRRFATRTVRRRTTRTILRGTSKSPARRPTARPSRERSRRNGIRSIACRRRSSRRRASPASAKSPTSPTTRRATCCKRRSPRAPTRGSGR